MSGRVVRNGINNPGSGQTQEENLSIEVTTRCTNDCRHCFARAGRDRMLELSLADARAVVDEAYTLGYRNLHLTGGEPLLWHHLFDLIDYADEKGYQSCLINTNGRLITDEIAKRFASKDMDLSLSISLHGPRELHDNLSGKGSFNAAVRGLRISLDAGVRVTVFTVARRALLKPLPRFAGYLFTEMPQIDDLTMIQLIRVPGDIVDLTDELLTPEDFLQLIRASALLNLYGYRISVLENPLAKIVAERIGMPWLALTPPLFRYGKIVLMADGSLTLAHSSRESLGRYKPGMLQEVMKSETYARMIGPEQTACLSCEFYEECSRNGLIRPSEWFRDSGDTKPFCRRVLTLIRNA